MAQQPWRVSFGPRSDLVLLQSAAAACHNFRDCRMTAASAATLAAWPTSIAPATGTATALRSSRSKLIGWSCEVGSLNGETMDLASFICWTRSRSRRCGLEPHVFGARPAGRMFGASASRIALAAVGAMESNMSDVLFYVALALVAALGCLVGLLMRATNPPTDTPPRGEMPRLSQWLAVRAPQEVSKRNSTRSFDGDRRPAIVLESVESVWDLWQLHVFTSRRIIEDVPSMVFEENFWVSTALQASAFPRTYLDWEKYEACSVEEVLAGPERTLVAPIVDGQLQWSLKAPQYVVDEWATPNERRAARERVERERERQVVEECGRVVGNYGLAVVARDPERREIVGGLTMRVKRLPQGCHIDEECYISEDALRAQGVSEDTFDRRPVVNCTVELSAVARSPGLEAVAYLDTIAVARERCGQGIAGQLLGFVEAKARLWGLRLLALHVHRDNWKALYFYERRGFEVTSDWMGWGPTYFLLLKPL